MMGDDVKERSAKRVRSLSAASPIFGTDTKSSQELISKRLREYYLEVAQQPVPNRFAELLNELERKSQVKVT
jgi:hypothetical protein